MLTDSRWTGTYKRRSPPAATSSRQGTGLRPSTCLTDTEPSPDPLHQRIHRCQQSDRYLCYCYTACIACYRKTMRHNTQDSTNKKIDVKNLETRHKMLHTFFHCISLRFCNLLIVFSVFANSFWQLRNKGLLDYLQNQ